jgi:hypothetical protein
MCKAAQMRLPGPGAPDDKLLGCVQMVCPTTFSGEARQEHLALQVLAQKKGDLSDTPFANFYVIRLKIIL